MKVRYWWSEDGEMEICEQKECVLEEITRCYHCGTIRQKGSKMCVLYPTNDEKYIMCVECAEKNTKVLG